MKRILTPQEQQQMRLRLDEDLRAGRLDVHEASRRMREVLGKSQADFARLVGVSSRTYIDFERRAGNPTLETLKAIGRLFGLVVTFGPADRLAPTVERRMGRGNGPGKAGSQRPSGAKQRRGGAG